MNAGIVGGIIGTVLGIMGGAIGTWFSIRSANSQRERAFMVKMAVYGWIAILVFLGLMFLLPDPYRHFLWIPYGILLPLGIRYFNQKQQQIRMEEEQKKGSQ